MSQFQIYGLASVLIFSIGLYGFIVQPHLVRKILAMNIMGSGIFLLLVSAARRDMSAAPDPVPHAMVLTGIVVSVSMTAFALALTRRVVAATGVAALPGMDAPEEATSIATRNDEHSRDLDRVADPVAVDRDDTHLSV